MTTFLDAVHGYDVDTIEGAIERGMNELGVRMAGVGSVVIKPNLVQAMHPESAAITHPIVVEAIINILKDYNIRHITIAEAPALGIPAAKTFAECGYTELAERKHVKLLDMMTAPRTDVHIGYGYRDVPNIFDDTELSRHFCGYLSIPNIFLESDIYINVPKLKTHNRTTVTLAMKNQWGMLSFADRQIYHRIGLHEPIFQLTRAIKPHLTVLDAVVGMEGNGPILGKPVPVGAVLLGNNIVESDIVGARLAGVEPESVPHIEMAAEAGLGSRNVEVRGERVEDLAVNFEPAEQDVIRDHNMFLWKNHRACHLDDFAMMAAAKLARRRPRYWMYFLKLAYYKHLGRLDMIRGRGMKLPEFRPGQKIIMTGDCSADSLRNFEEIPRNIVHIPGCPPNPEDIVKAIIRM